MVWYSDLSLMIFFRVLHLSFQTRLCLPTIHFCTRKILAKQSILNTFVLSPVFPRKLLSAEACP